MKITLRIAIFVLCLALILPVMVSCETETETESKNESATESQETSQATEAMPDVAKKDYSSDFYMPIQEHSNRFDFYWVEENKNDQLSDAIYTRQEQVRQHLGITLLCTKAGEHTEYATPIMTSVKNKDGSVHAFLSHVYTSVAGLISGNYLTDYKDMPGINLDADYWNLPVMEEVAANDHLYLGYSDFRLAYTYVITFNKELLDKYADALEESLYDSVFGYRWTLDKMISLANLVYVDKTGDGKTDDDTFGITGRQWVPFINFVQASNIKIVDADEKGNYKISIYSDLVKERTTILAEKLHELSKSDYAWFRYREESTKEIPMTSGQTLMHLSSTYNLPDYVMHDIDFGIVPYPLFDETQKDVGYRSLDWGGWICIPSYLENPTMVGETLEMLAFFSDDVTVAFYEKLLGKQVADSPDDKKMLDLVWDSVCSDIGLTYSNIHNTVDGFLYMLPNITHANTQYNIASYVQSFETTANKQIKAYFGKKIK